MPFFYREIQKGNITSNNFTDLDLTISVHGHCQQKSLEGITAVTNMLNLPNNFKTQILDTGCCGMAGAFGYEKEHYNLSMQVGEDSLLPAVRSLENNTIMVAAGTSCRHQILDGTKRIAIHPVSALLQAMKS